MATNPTLLTMPIAENGQKNTIPATQAAAGDGLLSQSTGFPPETALPLGAGGKAPTREDFNGAFNLLSDIAFYAQKGWTFQYDATQDYFKGCLVIDPSDGLRYECLNDMVAGTVSPHEDTNNDYWKVFSTGGGVPVGFIMPYAGTGLADGYLDCDGSAVSRTMYPDLFTAIGTTWGAGDGSTTFNLPNLIEAAILNGSYTKTTFTTAGSSTFTAPKSGFYKITVKGGGGGGQAGGFPSAGNYGESGGGGGEGGTTIGYEKLTAGDTATVVIGAGGTGGTGVKYARGANGGDSSVIVNLNTYTGGGGIGGSNGTNYVFGGAGGTGTIPGAPGAGGTNVYDSSGLGANGGGEGGAVSTGLSTPSPAINGGGGGGGYGRNNSTYGDGGNGGDGYVWFEYIGVTPKFLIKAFDAPTPSSAGIDLTQYAQDLANRLTREQTPAFNHRDVITTSGTYTAPVTGWYKITVKGGGGGGGGAVSNGSAGGGGEGGTTIGFEHMDAGDTATVVIGAGGTGGASNVAGTNGGNSSVAVNSNTYTGNGGEGGSAPGGYYGGAGGTGTIIGSTGETGSHAADWAGGSGGGNGGGRSSRGAFYAESGTAGGGGGGGESVNGYYVGGNGGDGFAWFEYFAAV